jgi:hypothetical protein
MKTSCAPGDCGPVADGCGGLIVCGACTAPQTCGGGGAASVCGGNSGCVPTTCAKAGASCGKIGDGCGGSLDCTTCTAPEICGGGGKPNVCGGGGHLPDGGVCMPQKTSCAAGDCGPIGDGCGVLLQCGSCQSPQICGGGVSGQPGTLSKCGGTLPDGGTLCQPRTCHTAGANCGPIGDGCGGVIPSCGDCPFAQICGGGVPSVCGPLPGSSVDGGTCAVCGSIPDCSSKPQVTKLTGRVITPGKSDTDTANQVGVPNAFVYILTNDNETLLPAIGTGIPKDGTGNLLTACDRCDTQDLGPVLVSATTDATGAFTLSRNIPVNKEFVLVVKIGKWRRAQKYTLAQSAGCATTALPLTVTRLPRTKSDGDAVNIPHIAVSTGYIDAMECVFYKMGVSVSEFALPGTAGSASARVHMYRSTDNGGEKMGSGAAAYTDFAPDTDLYRDTTRLNGYDMVVFDCEGSAYEDNAYDVNLRQYVNRGGRMFASHWSYTWLHDNGTLNYSAATALDTRLDTSANWQWQSNNNLPTSGTGYVSVGRPLANAAKIGTFASWLVNEGAVTQSGGNYTFTITEPRDLAASLNTGSEEWVYRYPNGTANGTTVQQYSFNTPFNAPSTGVCGRVAYSAFHVLSASGGLGTGFTNTVFPAGCTGDLSAQEKVLLFMLFDLAACIQPVQPPPTCTAKSCSQQGIGCGPAGDGCGKLLDCGSCPTGQTCGGGGVACQCGAPSCTKLTCQQAGAGCGDVADGCGGALACGSCPTGQVCGGGGAPNQCGNASCAPLTCQKVGASCGPAGDGCGNLLDCGPCPAGQTCGGAGVASQCGKPPCTATTCQAANVNCGDLGDGCGGLLHCGTCNAPQICGGGGVTGQCGAPSCQARTCQQMGVTCGPSGDGCGGLLDCGACPPACTPRTCSDAGANCGKIGDNCGALVDCGTCTAPETCGGGGTPNVCGRDYVP